MIVKILKAAESIPDILTLNIPLRNVQVIWKHFEKLVPVTVVDSLVVGEFHVGSDGTGGRLMDMMNSSFWHQTKSFE